MKTLMKTFQSLGGFAGLMMLLNGCGSAKPVARVPKARSSEKSSALAGGSSIASDQARERCDGSKPDREVNDYDTTGEGDPDVRKIYMRFGKGPTARLLLICREVDLNRDGRKDVVRYFDDNGQPLREEADLDFDGRIDTQTFFLDRKVIRREQDTTGKGRVDMKVFYENGVPLRIERDLSHRSTDTQWKPDRWEYFEEGKIVRMGTDTDSDGFVDHWDRDAALNANQETASTGGVAEQ